MLLSYLGTETSIKSDEVKLDLRLKSPFLQTYKIKHDRSLSYLGTETSIKCDEDFLLKFMYQDRRVSGQVLFCMSVRGGYEF
jgi:hypothetical protein